MIETISLVGVCVIVLLKARKPLSEKGAVYLLVAIAAGLKAMNVLFGK